MPGAKVVTITESTGKSGKSIAELVQGAHLVLTSYALFRLDEDGYTEFGNHVPKKYRERCFTTCRVGCVDFG